jgi:hypothetical protein
MKYAGSCHCGKIAYEVEGEVKEATECNCSICRRKGQLMWFLPGDKLTLKTPESDMAYYSFNKHHIKHYFCPVCGCAPFGMGAGKDGKPMVAVNLRCLPDVDLAGIKINHFDGKSL